MAYLGRWCATRFSEGLLVLTKMKRWQGDHAKEIESVFPSE